MTVHFIYYLPYNLSFVECKVSNYKRALIAADSAS